VALEAENYDFVKAPEGFFPIGFVQTKKLFIVLMDVGLLVYTILKDVVSIEQSIQIFLGFCTDHLITQ
jgi:hypothetical protein